jgi:hypothetical protein
VRGPQSRPFHRQSCMEMAAHPAGAASPKGRTEIWPRGETRA